MPLFIPVLAGAAGLWGGFVISDGTKRLSWLIVLGFLVFGLFKMGVI